MLPTGGPISFMDLNNELRRAWNSPLSLADGQLRALIGKAGVINETKMSEFYGRYLYSPYGTLLYSNVCDGLNLGNIRADGNGGSYFEVTQFNSVSCGYQPPTTPTNHPPYGTILEQYCSGTTRVTIYANGNGGTYSESQFNSSLCPNGSEQG